MNDLEDRIAKIIKDEYETFTGGHADGGHADVAAHEIMALVNAENSELMQLLGKVRQLALVIESAVRTADPVNHAAVLAMLKAVKEVGP